MKKIILNLTILSLFFVGCSKEDVNLSDTPKHKSLIEKAQEIEEDGDITRIEITDINLQKTTTGATKLFPSYIYNYASPIKTYSISYTETPELDTYVMGLKKGGPNGEILDVKVSLYLSNDEEWVEINGLRYNIDYILIEDTETSFIEDWVFTPTGTVPGTSNDYYTNLIQALNNANNGDVARPELPLANLRVLSLGSIKLRFKELF